MKLIMRDIQRGTKKGPPTRFEFKRKEKNPMKQGKNRKKKDMSIYI